MANVRRSLSRQKVARLFRGLRPEKEAPAGREKIIRPLLTASGQPEPALSPANPKPIDHHCEALRAAMRNLFTDLGIAA
jgi:hypothetical protein